MPCQWAITRLTGHALFWDSYIFLFNENTKRQNSILMTNVRHFTFLHLKFVFTWLVRKEIEFLGNKFLWTTHFLGCFVFSFLWHTTAFSACVFLLVPVQTLLLSSNYRDFDIGHGQDSEEASSILMLRFKLHLFQF